MRCEFSVALTPLIRLWSFRRWEAASCSYFESVRINFAIPELSRKHSSEVYKNCVGMSSRQGVLYCYNTDEFDWGEMVNTSACLGDDRHFAVNCVGQSEWLKNCKGKAVPLQAWSGPEGSRKLRFPDFMTTAQGGGKVKVKQSRYRPGVAQRVPGS